MLQTVTPRPNRLEEVKDEDYHIRYARWCIGSFNVFTYSDFVSRYMTNVAFYKGNQWIFAEDLDAFLMDESGEPRNRIKFIHNIIKPFVEYYRGAAVKMDLNAEVNATTREAKTRRDLAFDKVLFATKLAMKMQAVGNEEAAAMIQERMGGYSSTEEATQAFNNLFIDEYTRTVTWLMKYISTVRNNTDSFKRRLAENIALSGIGILKEFDRNAEQIWKTVAPERFIWDGSAEEEDLSDAEFMGEFYMSSAVDIFEECPHLDSDTRKEIERSSINGQVGLHNMINFYTNYAGKIPVYETYWRDVRITTHGAFIDEFGYPILLEITEDTNLDMLIPVDQLEQFADDYSWIRTVLNDGHKKITRNKKAIPVDELRYCKFIPGEYIGGGKDICLSYGRRPYQSKYAYKYSIPDFPYKVCTYSYIHGEIMSPIDALISPQRFLNRTLSVAESQINNSRGSGTVIDIDSVDNQGGEEEIQRNMNMSKPVYVRAGRQVNNVIGSYDSTIKSGTLNLFNIADNMKNVANDIFGGGQQVVGQGGAYRATGAVAQQNLSQGITMQEPFFYALEKIYLSAYRSMIGRGKRIYTANQRQLALSIGDEGVVVFQLTKDYDTEDFDARIIRTADAYSEKDAANQLLMILYDKQLIDDRTFAQGLNNSTTTDVAYLLRSFTGLKTQAAIVQSKQEARNQQIEAQQTIAMDEMRNIDANKQIQKEMIADDNANNAKIISSSINALSKEQGGNQE